MQPARRRERCRRSSRAITTHVSLVAEDIAYRSFVLLQAEWPVGRARDAIDRLRPSHVILRGPDTSDVWYLLDAATLEQQLAISDRSASLWSTLQLGATDATDVVSPDASAADLADRCIIARGSTVVGFYDADVPPRSGGTRGPGGVARHLLSELPERLRLGQTTSLVVYLSPRPPTDDGSSVALGDLQDGTPVFVMVSPGRGLAIDGEREGTLVAADATTSTALRFPITAIQTGQATVDVLAFVYGQLLGTLRLRCTVEAEAAATGRMASSKHSLATVTPVQPDLSLLVLERVDASGQNVLELRLTAADPGLGLYYREYGPVTLRRDAQAYFEALFKDIEQLPLANSDQRRAAEARLARKGALVFSSLLPQELQQQLWSVRDRIRSIHVVSEEPWIPWELCKLSGQDNGRIVEGPFLGEAYAITRWLLGVPPPPMLSFGRVALVAPEDSGLTQVAEECDFMLSLQANTRVVERVPATYLDVTEALASGVYDGWHISAHGVFEPDDPNRSSVYLRDGDPLTPEDLSGVVSNLGRAQPLVFLNACQVGRSALSLTGIGGWARQFLQAGAGAFLGAYWSVTDDLALPFARAFYERLIQGAEVGAAVRDARLTIKPDGDPSWLAYTVFANPMAKITVSPNHE